MNPQNPMQYSQPIYPSAFALNRTAGPVKIIGIIYAVLAALSVFGFIALLALAFVPGLINRAATEGQFIGPAAPGVLFGFLAFVVGISLLLHALTAYGLLALKPWGRSFAIVVSIVTLISFPIGTILGGFTLYFLMRQGAQQDYDLLVAQRLGYPPTFPPAPTF